MKKNIFLAALFLVTASSSLLGSQGTAAQGVANKLASAFKTNHSIDFDSKTLGESLGNALSKFQVGLSPDARAEFQKLTSLFSDPKALGELVSKFKLLNQNQDLSLSFDFKSFGEALSTFKINIDDKSLTEFVGSKQVQEAIKNLKLIPDNFTLAPLNIRLDALPHLPVVVDLKLSAENGRRIAGTAGATMAIGSILCWGLGWVNTALLCGSSVAISPESAKATAAMICNEQNATLLKNYCTASCTYAKRTLSARADDCAAFREKAKNKLCHRTVGNLNQTPLVQLPKPKENDAKRD